MKDANLHGAATLEEGTKAWWEAKKKNSQERLDALKDTDKGSSTWNAIVKEIEDAGKAIKNFDTRPESTREADKLESEKVKASKKLLALSVNLEKETDAAIVAAMEEGRDKKLAQLDAEYKARKALLEERTKDIEEMEAATGVDGSKQKGQLEALSAAEKERYGMQIRAVADGSRAAINSVMADIDARFRKQSEARMMDIDLFYKEQADKAQQNGATQAELDEIFLQYKRDIELEKQHVALETLDFEATIAIKRAQIEDRGVMLQAQREEKILKIQIAAAEKRLAKLKEIKEKGGDTDKDIAATTAEIEALNAALEKMPIKKAEELASHFKEILSSLGGIGGEFGEIIDAISGQVDNIMTSFSKDATTMDKMSAGIGGLAGLYNMAADQIEENTRKQGEWNDAIEEGEHRARMMRIESAEYSQQNLFGVESPYARAISGAKEYATAMQELNSSLAKFGAGQVQTGTKKVISGKNIVSGAASGAAAGGAIGSVIPIVGTGIGAAIGGLLGGIFGATQKKVVPIFNSLTKQFGSILKDGTETFELNPKILENYGKLDEATKKLVDNWEEIRIKALEAEKQMEENFRDLAGNIGVMLSDSLIDSFRNGAPLFCRRLVRR